MVSVAEGAIVPAHEGRPPVEMGAGRVLMEPMATPLRGFHANATKLATRIRFDVAAPRQPCDVNR